MSSIGVALRFCRRTNSTPDTTPIANAATTLPDKPSWAAVLIAHTNGSIAVNDSATPVRSSGPGFGSRDSGTSRGPSTSKGSRIGTATRNTEPQWKCCSSAPPTMGPSVEPAVKHEAQMAIASRRDDVSVKMLRISDSVDGISIAPKTPSAARATTR